MGITPREPGLMGILWGPGRRAGGRFTRKQRHSVSSTAVTERLGTASPSGSENTPNAEYDRLLLRGSLSAAERRLFVPALGPWLVIADYESPVSKFHMASHLHK